MDKDYPHTRAGAASRKRALPEDICRAISMDLKERGLTHEKAATLLGKENARSVSNQISGKRPFGKNSAALYAKTFGYEMPYLLYGIGDLKKKTSSKKLLESTSGTHRTVSWAKYMELKRKVDRLERVVAESETKTAIAVSLSAYDK